VAETPYRREVGYAERYRDRRFQSGSGPATDRAERAALRSVLARCQAPTGLWLDAPSGAGRLSDELPGTVVQVDRDPRMVQAAGTAHRRACASVHALPFADATFAGVLCHRLLQHIPTPTERMAILRELARTSSSIVVVSFFDRCSLQHGRRVVRRWLGKTVSGRSAVSRRELFAELAAAGLEPVATAALRRFVGEQTLVACRKVASSSPG
jgi:hypothetical protein